MYVPFVLVWLCLCAGVVCMCVWVCVCAVVWGYIYIERLLTALLSLVIKLKGLWDTADSHGVLGLVSK